MQTRSLHWFGAAVDGARARLRTSVEQAKLGARDEQERCSIMN